MTDTDLGEGEDENGGDPWSHGDDLLDHPANPADVSLNLAQRVLQEGLPVEPLDRESSELTSDVSRGRRIFSRYLSRGAGKGLVLHEPAILAARRVRRGSRPAGLAVQAVGKDFSREAASAIWEGNTEMAVAIKKRGGFLSLAIWGLHVGVTSLAGLPAPPPANATTNPVLIEYFFEAGCEDCERVDKNIMPILTNRCDGRYRMVDLELGSLSNYLRLVKYQERAATQYNEHVYMAVNETHLLQGYGEIADRLLTTLDQCLRKADQRALQSIPREIEGARKEGAGILEERLAHFAWAGVALAGLADGVNPCAFSTLVFFISLLAVAEVKGRTLLLTGMSFCLASFVTYFAIGFGLLRVLHAFWGLHLLRQVLEILMVGLLLLFAWLSFRDAFRYRASRNPDDITLQLPRPIRQLTHRVMHREIKTHHGVAMAFGIGALVTAIETVCTGQLYVPTLVFVVRSRQSVSQGLSYLALYNLMFVAPLVLVFALTYAGLTQGRLLAWSVRNVVISKCLLGFFFLAMAGLLVVL